jgi:protein-L-isoaspartate(D-aspartate) O-methyltransferase
MEDSYLHKGLRKKLVETIRLKGITDERVLSAIGKIPRHLFMDSSFVKFSYSDQAFPIRAGQTISQPYTVAFQTELLEIKPMEKVLEIGTGSGYQAAVLVEMGARVFSIERHKELHISSQSLLAKLGYKARFFYGDGYEGIPAFAPYDKILITAAAPEIPEKLKEQLKPGGIMVAPLGGAMGQIMVKIVKNNDNNYAITKHGAFAFVPMVKGKNG